MISVGFLTALALVGVAYWWISRKIYERKYKWIPKAPGHPIFGNALELGKSTDTLPVLSRYLKQCNGVCSVDVIVKKLVVISDLKLVEFLLTTTKILEKPSEYKFLHRWLGNGILTAKAARWRKSRKIITPAFHFAILGQFISVYESNADIMLKLLEKEIGEDSVDIYPYARMCALDIICETSMGVNINAQTDRQSDYVYAVKEMCRIAFERTFSAIKQLPVLYALTKDFYKELKYVKTLHSHTDSVIQARKKTLQDSYSGNGDPESEEKPKNIYDGDLGAKKKVAFLDLLLQVKVDGEPLPDWYIREEVDTLMFAGHDTTGSAISFVLYCLAEYPEVQKQAFEEQRTIFGKDKNRPVTFNDVQEMKYLELVIKETFRVYPIVPFFGRNTDVDVEYKDGKILPKGTTLMIFVYAIHKNPEVFPDPEKFDPLRFEKMNTPFTYLPFSAGPRNCIGQKFAMHEMKVVLSKILRTYELLPAIPKHNLQLATEVVLQSANSIKIKLKARNWD